MKLEDIAKELDLSIATVSRALNKETEYKVKDATKRRIFKLIKQRGFKPNMKARGLAKQKLTNFSFVLPVGIESIFYDEYYNSIIKGLNDVLLNTEYSLSILPIEKEYGPDEIFNILLNNETAGLILSPYCKYITFPFALMKRYGFPIVVIDNETNGKNCYNILLDHKGAGYIGGDILWNSGCRDLVLISDVAHSAHSELRKKGFLDFLKDKDPKDYSLNNIEFAFSHVSGLPALEEILRTSSLPVSVFSLNDEIAIGILNHMKEKGLRCPQDIRMLGFDGLSAGRYLLPRLNSLAFPFREVGKTAAKILIDVVGKKKVNKKTILEVSPTEGESLGRTLPGPQ